ncbi:MAG: hypothetical protein IJP92_10075 [Lachnospiraceae bacterium]|nr:hypothetical protein [Lachnospiraceae bacterium]
MRYKDIFEDNLTQLSGNSNFVDISTDEGMWLYLDALGCGVNVKWKYGSGKHYQRQIRESIKKEERIYIYGAGSAGGRTFMLLCKFSISVLGFIDSSLYKQGTYYYDKRILAPKEILHDSCIIVSCGDYEDVIDRLKNEMNKKRLRIYVDYSNATNFSRLPLTHAQIKDFCKNEGRK